VALPGEADLSTPEYVVVRLTSAHEVRRTGLSRSGRPFVPPEVVEAFFDVMSVIAGAPHLFDPAMSRLRTGGPPSA
jgi:hypothetical protein